MRISRRARARSWNSESRNSPVERNARRCIGLQSESERLNLQVVEVSVVLPAGEAEPIVSLDGERGTLVHLQHQLAVLLPAEEPAPPGDGLVVGAAALDLEVQPLHYPRRLRPVVGALLQLAQIGAGRCPDERAAQGIPQRLDPLQLAR